MKKDPFYIFSAAYIVLMIILFILSGAYTFALISVMTLIMCGIKYLAKKNAEKQGKEPKSSGYVAFIVAFSVFQLMSPPLTLHTTSVMQYEIQDFYVSLYKNVKRPKWFPEDITHIKTESFEFDYLPSVMQGTGHYSVTMKVSPEQLTAYEERYSERAKLTVNMSGYGDMYKLSDEEAKLFTNFDNVLDIYADETVKNSDTAVIYVIDAVLNFNHPRSSVVIVDKEYGIIQFSQLG